MVESHHFLILGYYFNTTMLTVWMFWMTSKEILKHWWLQYILFCQSHFKKWLLKAISTHRYDQPVKNLIKNYFLFSQLFFSVNVFLNCFEIPVNNSTSTDPSVICSGGRNFVNIFQISHYTGFTEGWHTSADIFKFDFNERETTLIY